MAFAWIIEASPALPLLICLSTIVIPALSAVILSSIHGLYQNYGATILKLFTHLWTFTAYLAQLTMIFAGLGCIYFSFGAYIVHLDDTIPELIVPLHRFMMGSALLLGFLMLMVAGLYAVEGAVWGFEAKSPTELAIVTVVWQLGDVEWKVSMKSVADKISSVAEWLIGRDKMLGLKSEEKTPTGEKEARETEITEADEGESDSEVSDLVPPGLSGAEDWE